MDSNALIDLISPLIQPLGYEVVYIEVLTQRQKVLRIFIDHLASNPDGTTPGIGIEDCVKVTRALDEPLEQMPEMEAVFKGAYELEVSSPGVDRPLRLAKDYVRFSGREVRIHVFRPLTVEELSNAEYQALNPKQKNFQGKVVGMKDDRVILALPKGSSEKKGKSKKAQLGKNSVEEVTIPLPLISKANLEPDFDNVLSAKSS